MRFFLVYAYINLSHPRYIQGIVRFRGTYRFRLLKGEGPLVRASSPTINRLSDEQSKNVSTKRQQESIKKQKQHLDEQEEEAIAKILRLRKQKRLLKKRETKITRRSLRYLDELVAVEEKEKKEREEKTRQEPQLLVSTSEVSAPTNTPQVYLLVDLSNPFSNPNFVASLVNYNPSDPFQLGQGISFSIPQTSQGS